MVDDARSRGLEDSELVRPALAAAAPASPAPSSEAAPHPVLAGYELLAELGRGSGGTVYLARRGSGAPVALKVLAGQAAADPEGRRRFAREATVSARIAHPGIVRVLEAGEAGHHLYIAMEYVAGTTLRDRVAGGALPPLEAARVLALVARAIEAAHAAGVVHRDLKPGNILMDRAGRPHVADFGLARDERAAERLTVSGDVLGTPLYMSPEQVAGERVERPTDVWALGVILWECLTGRQPISGASFPEIARSIEAWRPKAPSLRAPYPVPRALDQACLAALARDPHARPSAAELARALEGVVNEVSSSHRVGRPGRTLSRLGLALAGATGLLVGAVVARLVDVRFERDEQRDAAATLARVEGESQKLVEQLATVTRAQKESEAEARRTSEAAARVAADRERDARSVAETLERLSGERVSWGSTVPAALDRIIDDLALAPVSSATVGLRARLLLHRGRADEARRCANDARLLHDELENEPELLRLEAEADVALGRGNDGIELLERLARAAPRDPRGIYAEGFLASVGRRGSVDATKLFRDLEHAVELDPAFAAPLVLEAQACNTLADKNPKMVERAFAAASAAIKIDPTSAEAFYQRSWARFTECLARARSGGVPLAEHDALVRDLEAARAIDPRPELFTYEGKTDLLFDRAREALPSLEVGVARSPAGTQRRALALTWRGNARAVQGDERGALADWLDALAINPEEAGEIAPYAARVSPAVRDELVQKAPRDVADHLRAR